MNQTTAVALETFPLGWAIAIPIIGVLVLLLFSLYLTCKCSGHWHASVVRRTVKPPPSADDVVDLNDLLPVPGKLRVLSLNLFCRPWGISDDKNDDFKEERLRGFCDQYLDSFDLLCLQESFNTLNYRKAWFIKYAAEHGFPYHTEAPPAPFCSCTKFVDGGLLILSRLPFDGEPTFRSYTQGVGADALAQKGALHVCVRVPSTTKADKPYTRLHVFSTHLQATYKRVDWGAAHVQVNQLSELRDFVDELAPVDNGNPVCETAVTFELS